jgi:hypothetical protein
MPRAAWGRGLRVTSLKGVEVTLHCPAETTHGCNQPSCTNQPVVLLRAHGAFFRGSLSDLQPCALCTNSVNMSSQRQPCGKNVNIVALHKLPAVLVWSSPAEHRTLTSFQKCISSRWQRLRVYQQVPKHSLITLQEVKKLLLLQLLQPTLI